MTHNTLLGHRESHLPILRGLGAVLEEKQSACQRKDRRDKSFSENELGQEAFSPFWEYPANLCETRSLRAARLPF
jgi:hypothetical protein